ncbi:hypothetical protein BGZ72_000382 [Mortierella alpina]|nr:hypothetical protein BGZ72_000382 [Mortierella alpina]
MSKEDLVEEAMQTLALIHPHLQIPPPIETVVTRWSQDEFAQGSYSFVGKESDGEDYDRLAKPIGNRLHFAGEATCRHYPATAHGAYLSGIKVAKDILDMLIGPQLVQSQHANNTGDSHGISSETRRQKHQEQFSDDDRRNTHLTSVEESRTAHSPSPHQDTLSSQMHLGHGFVIPRRRGRVSTRMLAKFVADRSDDEVEEEDDNNNGIDHSNYLADGKDPKSSHPHGRDDQINVGRFNRTTDMDKDMKGGSVFHSQRGVQTTPTIPQKRGPGRPRKVLPTDTDPANFPTKRLRGPGRPRTTPLPEAKSSSIASLKRKPGRPKGASGKAVSAPAQQSKRGPGRPRRISANLSYDLSQTRERGPSKEVSAEANQLSAKPILPDANSEEVARLLQQPRVVRPANQMVEMPSSAARQTRSRYEARYYR